MSYEELQAQASEAMDMVFQYFKRSNQVVFYKNVTEQIVYVDPDWNSDFGYGDAAQITKTTQKQSFDCRIIFTKEPSLIQNIDGDENLGIKTRYPVGEVKIQVQAAGFEWLKEARAFYISGERFLPISDWRGIGLLGDYDTYELTLKKDQ